MVEFESHGNVRRVSCRPTPKSCMRSFALQRHFDRYYTDYLLGRSATQHADPGTHWRKGPPFATMAYHPGGEFEMRKKQSKRLRRTIVLFMKSFVKLPRTPSSRTSTSRRPLPSQLCKDLRSLQSKMIQM